MIGQSTWCHASALVPAPDLVYMTEAPFLVWLATGFAVNGRMDMALGLVEHVNGIGVFPGTDDNSLVLVYNSANPPVSSWEELIDYQDGVFLVASQYGFSCFTICNIACVHEISPSGRYFAIGADGTGVWRGPVDLIDLETCVSYRCDIPGAGIGACSNWIDGDYMLFESVVERTPSSDEIRDQETIDQYWYTEARDQLTNIVLMRGNRAWRIIEEDRYYEYRLTDNYGSTDKGLFFDVATTPKVIPFAAGIETDEDFRRWIDSMGGAAEAFPAIDFRIHVDTLNMSLSCSRI
jgi:hypothetical protein